MAGEEAGEALLAEPVRVSGSWVAVDERERDWAVDVGEHAGGGGPEAFQLGAQLVGERNAVGDEVLTSTDERPQRLRRVAIGDQDPEAVAVGTSELGEHEAVEAVALAARVAEAGAHRSDLVGVDRDHRQARLSDLLCVRPGLLVCVVSRGVGLRSGFSGRGARLSSCRPCAISSRRG